MVIGCMAPYILELYGNVYLTVTGF